MNRPVNRGYCERLNVTLDFGGLPCRCSVVYIHHHVTYYAREDHLPLDLELPYLFFESIFDEYIFP